MIGYSYEQIDEQVLLYEGYFFFYKLKGNILFSEDSPSTSSMKNEYRPWVTKTDVGGRIFILKKRKLGKFQILILSVNGILAAKSFSIF